MIIIKRSMQKPAMMLFSGLLLITSLVFTNQASLAKYDEHLELQNISYQIEEARIKSQAGLVRAELPSNSSINRVTNPLDHMFGTQKPNRNADGIRLSPTMNSMEFLDSENYTPVGETPRKKDFDPGYIISDFVFLDKDSMSVAQIQSFLEHMGGTCIEGEMPCLKDFKGKIPHTPVTEKGICVEIPQTGKVTAAEMIHIVAQACGINPQVILVTLQKEQGLLDASRPTSYMYRAAMGHNCPDGNSSACGNIGGGFWNQLRDGAEQKLWYGNPNGEFTYLSVGEKITRAYHPNESCGSATFELKNRATAALYYYTPYVPNSAALANMTGLGNDCSSYGNRNFFRLFNEWFGDSTKEK